MYLQSHLFSKLLISILMFSAPALAKKDTPSKREPAQTAIKVGHLMHISYGSKSWNTDSRKVDSAVLVLREKNSGQIVQIQLEETAPDSAQFIGRFNVDLGDRERLSPEVYVPPKDLRGSDKDNKKLYELIRSGKLVRKPLIWKKNDKGQAVLDVYDTREQAEVSLTAYRQEQKLAQELRRKKPLKPMASDVAMNASANAQLVKMSADAAKLMEVRNRLEQVELQQLSDRLERFNALSSAEKAKNKAKAAKLNAQADQYYEKGEYQNAEDLYKKVIELDPENKEFYYKYAVTLYRNRKFNESLVIFKIAKVPAKIESERNYYMGLAYYQLKDLDNSLNTFTNVAKTEDPGMKASALFYRGLIYYAQEKYDPAKKDFEEVIDTSTDPKLDKQAEEYLDRIAAAIAYQKLRENKFTVMGTLGVTYDSNVLLAPSNDQGTGAATDGPDYRLLTLLDFQYRPIFDEKNEWAPHATVNLTNSAKTLSAKADPFIYSVAAPFKRKLTVFSKGLTSVANPGYEVLYMDPNGTGTKALQLTSYYLGLDQTLTMGKFWISMFSFEYRNQKSSDPASIGPADISGNKYTFRTTQTVFIDEGRKQSLVPMVSLTRDSAAGSTKSSNRYDLGITYVRPLPWSLSWSLGFAYYQLRYPGALPARTDNDYTYTSGISKPLKQWLIWGLTGSYTRNNSTEVASEYTKYLIMTTATFITNF